jgi:hypothetical protein
MRKDWASGVLHAKQVLQYCNNAAEQGATGLGRLAGHATLENAHRDLVRALGYPENAPDIDWVDVPKASGFITKHPIVRPTNVFETLLQRDEQRFNDMIRGPVGSIEEYWRNLKGHVCIEAIADHIGPKAVPIAIHGDGAPTHKHEGLFTISWSSNTVKSKTLGSKFIFTTVRKGRLEYEGLEIGHAW